MFIGVHPWLKLVLIRGIRVNPLRLRLCRLCRAGPSVVNPRTKFDYHESCTKLTQSTHATGQRQKGVKARTEQDSGKEAWFMVAAVGFKQFRQPEVLREIGRARRPDPVLIRPKNPKPTEIIRNSPKNPQLVEATQTLKFILPAAAWLARCRSTLHQGESR